MTLPSTTDGVSGEFVTAAMRACGAVAPGCAVTVLARERLAEGIALSGQLARLRLAYRGDAGCAGPSTVILKIPPVEPENWALGGGFGFYVREGRFYLDLAHALPVRVPRCYGTGIDYDSGASALLLEDLGGWTPGCQITGAAPDEALAAVREMAALHAFGWDAPAGRLPSWLHRFDDPLHLTMAQLYRQTWPAFVEAYGDLVGPAALQVGERARAVFEELQIAATAEAPLTLCHGDWRMDNLMFGASGGVAVLDWQVVHLGPGVEDLAMFLTQSLPIGPRRVLRRDGVGAVPAHDGVRDAVPGRRVRGDEPAERPGPPTARGDDDAVVRCGRRPGRRGAPARLTRAASAELQLAAEGPALEVEQELLAPWPSSPTRSPD